MIVRAIWSEIRLGSWVSWTFRADSPMHPITASCKLTALPPEITTWRLALLDSVFVVPMVTFAARAGYS